MQHLGRFLKEFPEMTLVEGSEFQELLLWAHNKRYISLTKAPTGQLCFTPHDLEKAKMWKEKDPE